MSSVSYALSDLLGWYEDGTLSFDKVEPALNPLSAADLITNVCKGRGLGDTPEIRETVGVESRRIKRRIGGGGLGGTQLRWLIDFLQGELRPTLSFNDLSSTERATLLGRSIEMFWHY